MVYKVIVDEDVSTDLLKIDKPVRVRIYGFILKLETSSDPRKLLLPYSSNLAGYWKKRIGDYRVICQIVDAKLTVRVVAAGHRSVIYKQISKKMK